MSSDATGREIVDSTEVTDDPELWNEVPLLRMEDPDDESSTLAISGKALLVSFVRVGSSLDSPFSRGEELVGIVKEACLPSSAYRTVSPVLPAWNRLAAFESRRRCINSGLGC